MCQGNRFRRIATWSWQTLFPTLIAAFLCPRLLPAQQSPLPTIVGAVDVSHSRVYVFVDKRGLGHQHAVEGRLQQGMFHIQPGQMPQAELVFDMTSFRADTDQARRWVGLPGKTDATTQKKVTQNMLGPQVLDVRRFPTARFRLTSVQPRRDDKGQPYLVIQGQFTLHGVTRPVAVAARAKEFAQGVRIVGQLTIRQTQFGIKPYTAALGAVGVADPLTIYADLWVPKAAPPSRR